MALFKRRKQRPTALSESMIVTELREMVMDEFQQSLDGTIRYPITGHLSDGTWVEVNIPDVTVVALDIEFNLSGFKEL